MNFSATETQRSMQEAAARFAERTLAPRAADYDAQEAYPWESLKSLWEAGYLGMTVPEAYGGLGVDLLTHTLCLEEFAKADAAVAVIVEVHNTLHVTAIERWGSEALRQRYLPQLAGGKLGAFALTEPHAGSDASALRTRAERQADGYVLNGGKTFITSSGSADYYLVFAKTQPELGSRGISAFIVPKEAPGLRFGRPEEKLGVRAAHTADLVFDHVWVPAEDRLGAEGDGYKIALSSLDYGRVGIAAQALGVAGAALGKALEYARNRQQFGRSIAEYQAIQWKLADMATELEAARWLVYRAAWLAGQPGRHSAEIAKAKLFASEMAFRAASEALQIHGGYGYMRHVGVERLLRDSRVTQIYEGTSEIQRMIIASHLLRQANR